MNDGFESRETLEKFLKISSTLCPNWTDTLFVLAHKSVDIVENVIKYNYKGQ